MSRVDEIDALVIAAATIERLFKFIGTMQHDIACGWLQPGQTQQAGEGNASPFADGTPPLDTVMAGDLRARWERL